MEVTPDIRRRALDQWVCRRCGRCCEGPGLVRLTAEDVEAMSDALGMAPFEFTRDYTGLAPDRRELVLLDRADDACIFLTAEGTCRVHAAKPRQCRDFPRKWHNPGFERDCAGMRVALEKLLAPNFSLV